MASLTNKTVNELDNTDVTNKTLTSSSLTWGGANFTWAEGTGTWENPYSMANKAVNELDNTDVTNKAQS